MIKAFTGLRAGKPGWCAIVLSLCVSWQVQRSPAAPFIAPEKKPPSSKKLPVWIDTDPSIGIFLHEVDDGFALVQAFNSPELSIRGISTVYGNTSLSASTQIARELAERFGRKAGVGPSGVFPGAKSPDDVSRSTEATEALKRELCRNPLTYVALGPLTNLAGLLRADPKLAIRRIRRIVWVAGRSPGMRLKAGWWPREFHDANFVKDRQALREVLRSRIPLTLVPPELAMTMPLSGTELSDIEKSGSAGRYLAEHSLSWRVFWQSATGRRGGPLFDSFAIIAVTRPELMKIERRTPGIYFDVNGKRPLPDRGSYLLAEPENSKCGNEVLFCRSCEPRAKAVLLKQLFGRLYPLRQRTDY